MRSSPRPVRQLHRLPFAICLVAAVSLGLGGVAHAAIPSADGVIHACYTTTNPSGSMRVIDVEKGQICSKNEKALDFNQSGPRGPQGPAGPTGPSDAYSAVSDRSVNAVSLEPGQETMVLTTSVPSGSYAVTATLQLYSSEDPVFYQCFLRIGGHDADEVGVGSSGSDWMTMGTFVGTGTLPDGGAIDIRCTADHESFAIATHILAIKVGAVH